MKTTYLLVLITMGLLTISSCQKNDPCTELNWYQDADGDNFGNPNKLKQACEQPNGYVSDSTDFDDANASAYPGADEICFDGIDNDGDGFIDCDDWDCDSACDESQNCFDGIDNDGDGFIDCDDWDCDSACDESQNCNDGIDNDGDGFIDCDDWDCNGDPDCL
jgi:hypothetical protein